MNGSSTGEDLPDGPPVSGRKPCPLVALGASSGGLEAFQRFFARVRPDTRLAFVLVQHFAPDHDSLVPSLLSRHTPVPVQRIEDGMRVEPGRVYIIPPNAVLTIEGCLLRLKTPTDPPGRRRPIDTFFRSLAADQGPNAVAVVLSGTGSDGVLGVREVKEQGGLVVAQSPDGAKHEEMPRAAIASGYVDRILPVEEIPEYLEAHGARLTDFLGDLRASDAGHLARVCDVVLRHTGHDFSRYKPTTLERRLQRRMLLRGQAGAEAYLQLLHEEPQEVQALFDDLLIGVTHFFRDPEAWQAVQALLPAVFEAHGNDRPVRAWVAGCSSGEEAYSLAILLKEQAAAVGAAPTIQIFATDIDEAALQIARQARYPLAIAEQVGAERLERFFTRRANAWQLNRDVRDACVFSLHDLLRDPPFTRLDLVTCRNTLIYLDAETQRRVVQVFHYALAPGGLLFLGPSETAPTQTHLFRALDKHHRIFARKDGPRPAVGPVSTLSGRPRFPRLPAQAAAGPADLAGRFDRLLLDYAPAAVVVNEAGEIIHFSGRTAPYLEPPTGAPTLLLVDMARQGLRLTLRTALHKAAHEKAQVAREGIAFDGPLGPQRVDLLVRPLADVAAEPVFLVLFKDAGPTQEAVASAAEEPLAQQLEHELKSTRDYLQATIQELEAANEELATSNEELLSANEELQTSKEELQSMNEEFETVNHELTRKVELLDRTNSDLSNLFQSTRIATVFVDRELRVKRFTPAATEIFRLIPADLDRPIADLASRLVDVAVDEDLRHVLRTLGVVERTVRLTDGTRSFQMRLLPYRTVDDVIDGVVLTFHEVTEVLRAQRELDESRRHLEIAVAGSGAVPWEMPLDPLRPDEVPVSRPRRAHWLRAVRAGAAFLVMDRAHGPRGPRACPGAAAPAPGWPDTRLRGRVPDAAP